jgi:hypothetical protein
MANKALYIIAKSYAPINAPLLSSSELGLYTHFLSVNRDSLTPQTC